MRSVQGGSLQGNGGPSEGLCLVCVRQMKVWGVVTKEAEVVCRKSGALRL